MSIEVYREEQKAISKYLNKNDINHPYLLSNKSMIEQYGIQGVPFFVLIDEKLMVRSVYTGFSEKNRASIKKQIDELLVD